MGTLLTFRKINVLRVIAKKVLREFWTKHNDCEQQLKAWYHEASKAKWKNTKDIKREYANANFLSYNRVVFNIKGNHYSLIIRVNYDYQILWIRFIGTHASYNKIDATKI